MNATQVQPQRIPLNYFTPKAYVKSEPATGLMSTPQGKRLIAIPEILINSINATLIEEAGEAAYMAFYTFGSSWGKSFYERTHKEIEVYYKTAITQINAPEFFAIVQEIWGVHGLGKIIVDFSKAKEGVLMVTVMNSGISKFIPNAESKSFSIESGFLGGWFSAFARQDLNASAIEWDYSSNTIKYILVGKG